MSNDNKRRKILAVLAGGLILGVGAAVTLAAWNDSEFASGTFTAGSFTFKGAADGSTFTDHPAAPGAPLAFTVDISKLSPEQDVYTGYALELTGDYSAAITEVAPDVTGTIAGPGKLTFAAKSTGATFGCDSAAFTAGSAVPTTMAAGSTVNLCLKITAGDQDTLDQGDTGTVTWQWIADSQ